MVWRDPRQVLVRSLVVHTKELPSLPLPPSQVRSEHGGFACVLNLARLDVRAPLPDLQLCFACRTEVAHPLRVPAWRNQVSHATDLHRVYRNFLHLPGLAPAYREHMRATDAEPQLRQPRDKRVDEAHRQCV